MWTALWLEGLASRSRPSWSWSRPPRRPCPHRAYPPALGQGRGPLVLAWRRDRLDLLRDDHHGEEPHPFDPCRGGALHPDERCPDLPGVELLSALGLVALAFSTLRPSGSACQLVS